MYRYRLPYDNSDIKKKSEIINGFQVFVTKWIYSKKKIDLPGTIEEYAHSMKGFSNTEPIDKEERIRASHYVEVPESVKEDDVIVESQSKVSYHKLKKSELIDLLIEREFSELEYKGKTKAKLIALLELDDEVSNETDL